MASKSDSTTNIRLWMVIGLFGAWNLWLMQQLAEVKEHAADANDTARRALNLANEATR